MSTSLGFGRPEFEVPIEPVYAYRGAGESIVIHEGQIDVEGIGVRQGRIELKFTSKPRLLWSVEPQEEDPVRISSTEATLTVQRGSRAFKISAQRVAGEEGWINAAQLGQHDDRLCRVRLHWMNLPEIRGPIGLVEHGPGGAMKYWMGRWQVEVNGWHLTLDSRPDYSKATADTPEGELFLLTHAMEIRRLDGSEFTAERAEQLIEQLRVTFSFAFGHWVAPVLPQGYGTDDRVVWEKWISPICDPYRPVPSAWLWMGRPDDLSDLVQKAIPLLSDPNRLGITRLQMQLAVSAVAGGFVEQRILAASPALENLAWSRLVFTGRWTEAEYKARYAEDRLRYLLQEARIPTNIDSELFPGLAAFASARGLDGPSAVTKIRNFLVHPQLPENELMRQDGLVQDAWRMLRRYVTLLILHDLGYGGSVVDPAKRTGWAGDADEVPWAGGSVLPPMPPNTNAIRNARRSSRPTPGGRHRGPGSSAS